MKKAIYKNKMVTVEQFLTMVPSSFRNFKLQPVCPCCQRKLEVYGAHSIKVVSRFDHPDGVRDCPLSAINDARYASLNDVEKDDFAGIEMRARFFEEENLRLNAAFWISMTGKGAISAKKIQKLISIADGLDIWSYRQMPLWALSFIFLTLDDFSVVSSNAQKGFYDLRFIFNKQCSSINKLWLDEEEVFLEKRFVTEDGRAEKSFSSDKRLNPLPIGESVVMEEAKNLVGKISQPMIIEIKKFENQMQTT